MTLTDFILHEDVSKELGPTPVSRFFSSVRGGVIPYLLTNL